MAKLKNAIGDASARNASLASGYNTRASAFNNALLGGQTTTPGSPAQGYQIEEYRAPFQPKTSAWRSWAKRNFTDDQNPMIDIGAKQLEEQQREAWEKNNPLQYRVGGNSFSSRDLAQQWIDAQPGGTPGQTVDHGSGLYSQFQDWSRQFNGLDYSKFWDDPTTAENENLYDSLFGTGQTLRQQLAQLNPDFSAPDFTTVVQGEDGGVRVSAPGLVDPREDIYNQINTGLGSYMGQLDQMLGQRRAEEQRIGSYQDDLTRTLAGYQSTLGQLGIGDENQLNSLERELSGIRTDMDLFGSPILEQLGGWRPQLESSLSGLTAGLGDLQADRQTELDRISAYEQDLLGKSDLWYGQLQNATIADEDLLRQLDREIDDTMRNAGRFSSELNFDLSQETGELQDLDWRLSDLQAERQAELNRISQAQSGFSSRADSLRSLLDSVSRYDGSALDSYGNRLGDIRNEMQNFDSVLATDFSAIDPRLAEIEAALGERRQTYNQAIDPLEAALSAGGDPISGLELWDTEGRKAALDALLDVQGDLAPYTGTRVSDLRTQLQGYLGDIDTQTEALTTKRGELTGNAEALLEQITGGQYYNEDQVAARRTEADELAALIEQYGASSGEDEIAGITDFLQGQTNRLQQDQQNLAARRNQGGTLANQMLGIGGIEGMRGQNYLTDDQIAALMSMLQRQEDPTAYQGGGVFSQSLGV